METIAMIGGILGIFISLGTLAGFFIFLLKESEAKGRLLQRIDNMEQGINDAHNLVRLTNDKVNVHDGDIIKVTANIESIHDLMERMDKKIDSLLNGTNYGRT